MARTDYYNDPDAPPANSVVPSTTAVVTDDQDRIVLIRRRDNDLWALPGGGMELGESIVDTAVREVKEETGLDVEVRPHRRLHQPAPCDGLHRRRSPANNFRCASPPDSSAGTSVWTPKVPTSPGPIRRTFPR